MRLLTAVGVAVLAIGISASLAHAQAPPYHLINQLVPPGVINAAQQAAAQEPDDLSRLLTTDRGPISVSFRDVEVANLLGVLAEIGRFEIQFSRDIEELPPVSLEFQQSDYEDVLRFVLNLPGLGYVVVGDGTLVVYGS